MRGEEVCVKDAFGNFASECEMGFGKFERHISLSMLRSEYRFSIIIIRKVIRVDWGIALVGRRKQL